MLMKVKYLFDYFKYLKNPFEALKFKFGFSDNCTIKIKNTDSVVNLKNVNSLNRLMARLPTVKKDKVPSFLIYIQNMDNDDEYLEIDGIKFINIYNSNFIKNHGEEFYSHLIEFFTDDVFDILDYEGRHVVDIGGNIGDTALYFAKLGADVISFEPVKHLYDLAVENVKINNDVKNNIVLVNKAIGGKRGVLHFDDSSIIEYVGNNHDHIMEVITIADLLEQFDFTPDILKMDCEGCEFEIILNSDLSMFNDIIFEHHQRIVNKDYTLLVNELQKQGFKIQFFELEGSVCEFNEQGMIYAHK